VFSTQGDPIVKSGDGLSFSVNKPGSYTALKSKSGDFLMQQKVSLTKDKRHYNTAMGFKLGKSVVTFDTKEGAGAATMKVNGKPVTLGYTAFSTRLDDGTKVAYDPASNKVTLESKAGDKVVVHRAWNEAKTHYLNATVTLAGDRPANSVSGVLGTLDAGSSSKDDARMRDGSVFKGKIGDLWKTPEAFIKEWRSKPDESLL
jgi:hypothetical protein